MASCSYLDQITVTRLPDSVDGCEDCLQPREQWVWCFADEFAMEIDGIEGETRIPPSPLGA